MNIKNISMRLELSFWNFAIALLSESPAFQKLVTWIYRELTLPVLDLNRAFDPKKALVLAAAGWTLGFLAGLLILFI